MNENPFPGMNPWLEFHWGDMHTRLTTYACDQLQPQLPSGLRARIEEYVAVETDEASAGSRSRFAPDVRVIERPERDAEPRGAATSTVAVAEPLVVPRQIEALIDMAYVNGRYYDDIDYREDPHPPLTRADAEWADQRLRENALR